MDAEGEQSPQERYARALFMDPRVEKATADAFMHAMQETARHMREVQPRTEDVVRGLRVGRFGRPYGGAVVDTIALSIGPLPASIRDTWLASVILASFAAGVAYGRRKNGPVDTADVETAKEGICDRFPKCTQMRVEASARAANELALNWHRMFALD